MKQILSWHSKGKIIILDHILVAESCFKREDMHQFSV